MGNCAVPEYVLQTDVSQRQTQVGLRQHSVYGVGSCGCPPLLVGTDRPRQFPEETSAHLLLSPQRNDEAPLYPDRKPGFWMEEVPTYSVPLLSGDIGSWL